MKRFLITSLLSTLSGIGLQAQEDTTNYYDLSLSGLWDVDIETASKKSESVFDAPVASSLITKEEIIRSGATTIEEVFRLIPGMIIREQTNGNFDIHIRGFDNLPPGNFSYYRDNSISLVMIDGRVVYNHMNGGTLWESLPIAITDIEKIEVVRGPNSALYGPNAASGVINIITSRSLTNDKSFQLTGNVKSGNLNSNMANVSLKGITSNGTFLAISANADYRERGQTTYYDYVRGEYVVADSLIDYLGDLTGPINNAATGWPDRALAKEKFGLNVFANHKFGEKVELDFSAGYQSSNAQVVFTETSTTPLTPRKSNSFGSSLQLKAYGLDVQWDQNIGTADLHPEWGNIWAFNYRKESFNVEYDYNFKGLNIRPGVSYQQVMYSDEDFITEEGDSGRAILNSTRNMQNLAAFVRADYTLKEKIRFVAAVRNDQYLILKKQALSYQGSITFSPNDYNRFRFVSSKANRAPFFAEMYAGMNTGGQVFRGDESLELMTVTNQEIGYRGKLKGLEIDLEAFYSESQNYAGLEFSTQELVNGAPKAIFQYRNYSLKAVQTGISGNIGYQFNNNLRANIFGTYQQTILNHYEYDTNPFDLIPVLDGHADDSLNTNTPKMYGGFKVSYSKGKFEAFTNGYYLSQHQYWYRIATDDIYDKFRMDLNLGYYLSPNVKVFFTGRNIFNNNKKEFGFVDNIGGLYLGGIHIDL